MPTKRPTPEERELRRKMLLQESQANERRIAAAKTEQASQTLNVVAAVLILAVSGIIAVVLYANGLLPTQTEDSYDRMIRLKAERELENERVKRQIEIDTAIQKAKLPMESGS